MQYTNTVTLAVGGSENVMLSFINATLDTPKHWSQEYTASDEKKVNYRQESELQTIVLFPWHQMSLSVRHTNCRRPNARYRTLPFLGHLLY